MGWAASVSHQSHVRQHFSKVLAIFLSFSFFAGRGRVCQKRRSGRAIDRRAAGWVSQDRDGGGSPGLQSQSSLLSAVCAPQQIVKQAFALVRFLLRGNVVVLGQISQQLDGLDDFGLVAVCGVDGYSVHGFGSLSLLCIDLCDAEFFRASVPREEYGIRGAGVALPNAEVLSGGKDALGVRNCLEFVSDIFPSLRAGVRHSV